MSLTNSDRDLVKRYLNGDLSGIELENFRERLQSDNTFHTDVDFQNLLRSGILFSKEEELRKKIIGSIKFRKTKVPVALKLIFTFVMVTILGITLWFYVGKDSATHSRVNLLFPFLLKEKNKISDKKNTKEKVVNENAPVTSSDTVADRLDNQNANEGLASVKEGESFREENRQTVDDTSSQVDHQDEELVIRKDQLLISLSLPVSEKSTEKKIQEHANLTGDVIQKLNPAAGVPEEEVVASAMEAEFWVSPVNYRGYKMSKNKLILFGIEEPDAVKLFRSNDVLYMKYGNEFFRLTNTFEFISYQRLKETDIPLAIKQ